MSDRCMVSEGDEFTIDVPHTPEAEAALIQEVRERLSHLRRHVGEPQAVFALESIDEDLEAIMYAVANTDEYECPEPMFGGGEE